MCIIYSPNKIKQQEDASFRLGREDKQQQWSGELMISVRIAMKMAFLSHTTSQWKNN